LDYGYSDTPSDSLDYGYSDTPSDTPSTSYTSDTPTDSYQPYSYTSDCPTCGYSDGYSTYTPSAASSYVPSYSSYGSTYVPASMGGSTGGGMTYVPYNSNTNTNNNVNNNESQAISNSNATGGNATATGGSTGAITNVNNNTVVIPAQPTTPTTPTTPVQQNLDGSCTINPSDVTVGESVTFSANATGGNGNYQYNWSGSNGISSSGQSFTGYFSNTGTQTANVTITSNGQSITRSCSVNVQGNQYGYNNNSAYCVGSPSNVGVGQTVAWTVYVNDASGSNYYNGNGGYTYTWNGTDNLYGSGQTINTSYSTAGSKTANVTVSGNGQTVSASCNINVGQVGGVTVIQQPGNGTPVSGVYLSQVPATGISFSSKIVFFVLGLLAWSGFVAYVYVARKKSKLALAGVSTISKADAFKMKNLAKQNIVA
jgi:hypothetical protein